MSNKINAGVYLLNRSVVDRIPEGFCMIETGVFPQMSEDQQLHSITLKDNFWNDVGQPKDYLVGQQEFLKFHNLKGQGDNFRGNVLVDPTAKVSPKAIIGPNVVIGAGCIIEDVQFDQFRESESRIVYCSRTLQSAEGATLTTL